MKSLKTYLFDGAVVVLPVLVPSEQSNNIQDKFVPILKVALYSRTQTHHDVSVLKKKRQ